MARKRMSVGEFAAIVQRGDLMQENGDPAGALREYELALREAPDDPMIWNNRGVALSSLGRYDEAMGSYRKATELRPGYWMAWFNLGKAIQRKARDISGKKGRGMGGRMPPEKERALEEAITIYDRALALNPAHTSTMNNKAVALRELRMNEEALLVYDELLNIDPTYAHAWHNKGKLLEMMGLPDEADRCFEIAASLNPHIAGGRDESGPAGPGRPGRKPAMPKDRTGGPDETEKERTDLRDVEPPRRAKRKTG